MARMHARKRGKSGSTKPLQKTSPVWVAHKPKEVEQIILNLAKKRYGTAKIGLTLRDTYGVPDAQLMLGKTISKVLEEHGLTSALPEDLFNLMKRAVMVREHLDKNSKDNVSRRGLQLIESKIRRLSKYYKKKRKISQDWRYDAQKARIIVRG